jgi:hypothetical protein
LATALEGDYDDELYFATDQNLLWRRDADAADWVSVSGKRSEILSLPGTVYREAVNADTLDNPLLFYYPVIVEH